MGVCWSQNRKRNYDNETMALKQSLYILMRLLSPDELLLFAMNDAEIWEICKCDLKMREMCIVAAVRRYHAEKLLYEEVHNRTANYMRLLDEFLPIQDEYDQRMFEESNQP